MSNIPFDPSRFTVPNAKPLPVVLLLDVSGSMGGEKIRTLNEAVRDMLNAFRDTETNETEISVAIITFGSEVKLHQPLASAGDIEWQDLVPGGLTPLGVALQMAKAMLEDRDVVPSRAYRPTVVLVSDGHPDPGWEAPLRDFISDGRSAKCDRMAMAIGAKANEAVLGEFIAGTSNQLFYSENARQLREFFKFVTMSVTIRTQSQTPNVVPDAKLIEVKPATIEARPEKHAVATENVSEDAADYW
ncbi:VWA domain-containing protein [Caballeronia sp. S22]|uniref:vWA domain-containing protein n=1 Tax=Caballeronia sp. S22 TaxID=3137182 RepID=UPI0035317DE6